MDVMDCIFINIFLLTSKFEVMAPSGNLHNLEKCFCKIISLYLQNDRWINKGSKLFYDLLC